ncbi:hypothetical protein WN55_05920 [Dufourea novaeangliae]|uniref:Uncharacterized protein n=1 Tax=Dufourea novaeangliae TaxID=178035 RepID=A0A154PMZ7_DUFNO|nr:hypothetical protein WN55_05920 [Dufourea novaeangliae]
MASRRDCVRETDWAQRDCDEGRTVHTVHLKTPLVRIWLVKLCFMVMSRY